ncbi:Os03g0667850 [Oryza sativa Japonica Group]|jgi:hypothetical protein|uniref:Os03g0667850 protein n=1 Tax=Oryza sativa subsp. japonica TaxID=39947 RepID=A0A0N7KHS8_ORYSJ|nr:Os03g0667850 [Oryza sativa Japonica Group]
MVSSEPARPVAGAQWRGPDMPRWRVIMVRRRKRLRAGGPTTAVISRSRADSANEGWDAEAIQTNWKGGSSGGGFADLGRGDRSTSRCTRWRSWRDSRRQGHRALAAMGG